ncbi:DALR anticodon-binding domain-containing protein [Wukongibacter sp. M2B1]|uniref:DALR anticodon-binding domain-containing protein n=1 Tax=Wukongibacter sp. M2B1 TaxID=3088895 RepID=UPI003D7A06F9
MMKQAIEEITDISLDIEEINIDISKRNEHGDFTSNIAMKLSSKANMKPQELGIRIKDKLVSLYDFIEDIQIVGPGFVNFFIKEESFIKESLQAIENGEFKKIELERKNVNIIMLLDDLNNILKLQNLRAFINMYYLGNIYSFAGCESKRIVLVKNYEDSQNIVNFLPDLKKVEITKNPRVLQEGIVFCHKSNQGLFEERDQVRLVIEDATLQKNGFEVYNVTPNGLCEEIGFERIKYTLANKSIAKEAIIELTKNDLRYIQYPYSRISSIINILKNEGIDIDNIEDFKEDYLKNPMEQQILKKILGFKDAVNDSINQNQPYRFIKYANELCAIFYKINERTLFRQLQPEKLIALLKLLNCVKIAMKEILTILDLPIYEKM